MSMPFDLNKDYEFPWLDKKHPYPSQGMDEEIYDKPYSATKLSIVVWTYAIARVFHMILYYMVATDKNPSV